MKGLAGNYTRSKEKSQKRRDQAEISLTRLQPETA